MRRILWVVLFLFAAVVIVAAGVLVFDEPQSPPELISVTRALDAVDFSSLPEARAFTARDGTQLVYRAYPGSGDTTAILIHGATFTSASMHVVSQALQARGATVYSLGMRGHEGGGRSGDVDYIGQLADDVEDFVKTLPPKASDARRVLIGFSAGGGLALTIAGSARGKAFDKFVLLAPALAYNAPTARPGFGGFVNSAMPRILILLALNRVGVDWFNGLATSAFAAPKGAKHSKTRFYTLRMAASFGARFEFAEDLKAAPGPVALIVGGADEVFFADQYGPVLKPTRPDLDLTVLPGLNHMDVVVKQEAVAAVAEKATAR